MPKVSPVQTAFNAGELSPLLAGRVDFDKYKTGLKTCLNMIPLVQGGLARRPGTVFVAEVKDSSKATRLVRFQFSTTQAYILEFGNLYFRVYKDHGQVVSGSPVEVVTPYATADLFQLKFVQSADTLYVAHPSYAPRKITRTSHTSWSIAAITFLDGPYLNVNATATTLTPSATTGTGITITASAVTGINGGAGFRASDVGRPIRLLHPGKWGWARITAVPDTTHVTADVVSDFGATTATDDWRLGLWNSTDGYPGALTFFEDRLGWGGAGGAPSRFDLSRTSDYENMAPTDPDGTVTNSHAIAATLNSNDVQVIRWMVDDEKALLVGTVSGEWPVRASSQSEALTPTNISAKQATTHGSANIAVLRAGKAALYVQKAGRKVRELAYVYESDGFKSPDMTVLSEHITAGGIVEMAYQQEPQSIVWAARADGTLLGFTYERDQNVLAWHRHELGGDGIVESVAVIPAPDGTRDELWMVVRRTIGGATKRYVEYMSKLFDAAAGDAQEDAFFVDCGLTYDGAAATSVSGLTHLEGQTVTILADGATHPTKVVSAGAITLERAASVVQVGLGYNSDGQQVRNDAGAADGTAQGKTQRAHRITFRVHETLGLKVGPSFDSLTRIPDRTAADDMGAAVPLFTGDRSTEWEGDYTTDNTPCWRFDQPLPGTILAIMPQQMTQDR